MNKLWDYKNEEWKSMVIDIDQIKGVSKYNARKEEPDVDLDSLAMSLRETGINTRPIILDENFEVIEGNRRYRAAKKAGLKKVWVLQKPMTKLEKIVRSFVENELQYDMTYKDRYIFAKTLREMGLTVDEIAAITGRSKSTIFEWLGYEKVPETVKQAGREEDFKRISSKKKQVTKTILRQRPFKDNPEAASKIIEIAREGRLSTLEEISSDARIGALDTYTVEKLDQYAKKEKVTTQRKEYDLKQIRIPIKLEKRLARVFKFEYPKKIFEDAIILVLEEYVDRKERELGLLS